MDFIKMRILKLLKIAALFALFLSAAGISAYLSLTFVIKSEDKVVVPELGGKDLVYSLEILTDLGLNIKVKGSEYSSTVPKNHIIFQDPEPGATIKKDRDVRIVISKGTKTVVMPKLNTLSLQQAKIIIEENDLAATHPQIVERMAREFSTWAESARADQQKVISAGQPGERRRSR